MTVQGKILQQRYRIESKIGQGGMGAVYVATDRRFGSAVAIKETLCPDENYHKAIEREARLLNSLKHPALPRVTDHFTEENVQYLVMEYVPGEDLGAMLERSGGPFSLKYVLNWADQLLDALSYLHSQEVPVIHRDIKPQNLKLTPQGQVVLLDFGLAKGNPTDASHNTTAKSLFGYSRNYAALEQIQGTGTDPRSDIYSLAATLHHLSTGQPPVDALTRAMRVVGRRPDPLVPAHLIRGDIPSGFSAVLNTAMELDGEARPRSAAEFRGMLRRYEEFPFQAPAAMAAASQSAVSYVTDGNADFETHVRMGTSLPQSSIPTEVMPANPSGAIAVPVGLFATSEAGDAETKVSAASTTVTPPRRKFAAATVLGAIMLLVFAASAGALYYGPSALFGGGSSADGQGGQAVPGGEPASQGANGGVESRDPASSSQIPVDRPAQPGESIPSNPPAEPEPEPPAIDPGPADPGPKTPGPTRAEKPRSAPKENPQGRRVDSVEIDRLPGGVRGVKVTRERPKKPASGDKDDGSGFRFTKIPGIFKSVPSKMRIVPPKKKKTKQ